MGDTRAMKRLAVVLSGALALAVAPALPTSAAPPTDAYSVAHQSTASARVTSTLSQPSPAHLAGVGNATQVIVVTDPHDTSYATLTAWQRTGSVWKPVLGPVAARIGSNGFTTGRRIQGSGTTPVGSFTLNAAFGQGTSPGTRMPYRQVREPDRWVYDASDPSTYNTYQPYQPSKDWGNEERLAYIQYRQYRYAVVIGFNHPVMSMSLTAHPHSSPLVDIRQGGGIFLHVTKVVNGTTRPTAGCVSVAERNMRNLLRWLNPATHPRIIMGPRTSVMRHSVSTSEYPAAQTPLRTTQRIGTSAAGRPIIAIRLGAARPTHRLVVVGVIHGDEREGLRVVQNIEARRLPAGLAVWLIPTMNPDGWATNSRRNGHGVDLNRNFPRLWEGTFPGTSTYSGPRAASEPETRGVEAFLHSVNPNLVVIFHSPLNGVDSDGMKSPATVAKLARLSGFPVGNFTCNGGCHGTLTQWFNHAHHGQAITFEFGQSRPSTAIINRVSGALLTVGATAP